MEAALPGSALGRPSQFVPVGVENIRRNRLKKAGGIVFFGLGGGETAFHPAILESLGNRLMNGTVGGKGAGGGEGMVSRQNEGVGKIASMLDQPASGIAADKGIVGGNHGSLLKVSDRNAGGVPSVDSQDRGLDVAQQGLVDRHIAGGGGRAIEQ